MEVLYRTLKWPVIGLLITGALHFSMEAIWPDLHAAFTPPVIGPVVLAYGLWVGSRAIQVGGTYLHAILAGAIAGVLPILLEVVGFGMVLGRGVQAGLLAGLFGFAMIVFGSLIGGGFVRASREPSSA
jgi:hypothetical protein